jgi:hypothetical protein
MGNMRVSFIEGDLLYRGTLKGRFDCIWRKTWFLTCVVTNWIYSYAYHYSNIEFDFRLRKGAVDAILSGKSMSLTCIRSVVFLW